jgi:hypothetical protein
LPESNTQENRIPLPYGGRYSPLLASALARSDPTLLSKTDPGGLWLILERQVTLLQMAIAEG